MSTNEMTATVRAYREIQAEIKALEEQADALKQQMINTRQAGELKAGEYTIRYMVYESNRLDTAKLKAERAELYSTYCKRIASVRFSIA